MTLKQKLMSLTKDQLIIILQAVLKRMGKKRTFAGLSGPKHALLHHGGGNWNFAQVDDYHRRKWGFKSSLGYYCGYHYFIEFSGKLIQARADTEEAAHTVEAGRPHYWNRNSIGICLQGNFENRKPTDEQLKSLKKLLRAKQRQYDIPMDEIYGHQDISPTLCPGKYLYEWVNEYRR